MSRVYIINKGGHNFDDAKRYGDLVFCSEGIQNRFAVDAMYRMFVKELGDSTPDDYLLLTSLSILCTIAALVWGRMHGRVKLLLYKNEKYVCREIIIDELLERIAPFKENN
jgi:hypothetical protein